MKNIVCNWLLTCPGNEDENKTDAEKEEEGAWPGVDIGMPWLQKLDKKQSTQNHLECRGWKKQGCIIPHEIADRGKILAVITNCFGDKHINKDTDLPNWMLVVLGQMWYIALTTPLIIKENPAH